MYIIFHAYVCIVTACVVISIKLISILINDPLDRRAIYGGGALLLSPLEVEIGNSVRHLFWRFKQFSNLQDVINQKRSRTRIHIIPCRWLSFSLKNSISQRQRQGD